MLRAAEVTLVYAAAVVVALVQLSGGNRSEQHPGGEGVAKARCRPAQRRPKRRRFVRAPENAAVESRLLQSGW